MVWWAALLVQVGFQILSALLSQPQKPKPEDRPTLPQNDGSQPIPVAFGDCLITGASILDWFDYQFEPIKVRNWGTFGITSITVGYRYFLGMVFALCWDVEGTGQCELEDIYIDDKRVFTNPGINAPQEAGVPIYNQLSPCQFYWPSLFGARNQEGGVWSQFVFYTGQDYSGLGVPLIADEYWEAQRGTSLPHYKDLCRFMWYGPSYGILPFTGGAKSGHIGNSGTLWPIAFRLTRRPLLVSPYGAISHVLAGDAYLGLGGRHSNPADVLYELLTSTRFGKGIDPGEINFDEFQSAAYAFSSEQYGFSYLWTQASSVDDMIAEVLRYVNAVLWTDAQTGKIRIKLIRDDYDVDTLPVLSNDDLTELESYRIGGWEDTYNEVRVTFPNHANTDFKEDAALWQSPANKQIQGETRATEIHFEGCPTMWQALRLAEREGHALSIPPITFTAKVDRKQFAWHPGFVFKWDWPEQGLNGVVMRVTSMKLGTVLDGAMEITCVRDVFAAGVALQSAVATTIWTDPVAGDAQDATAVVGEIPYFFQRDDSPRAFGVAARPTPLHMDYDGALDGSAEVLATDFTPSGTLAASLAQVSGGDYDATGFVVEEMTDATAIDAPTLAEIAAGSAGLAFLGDPAGAHEWIAFESANVVGTTVTLDNIWRGVMDTPPLAHTAGTRVWFFSTASAMFPRPLANGQSIIFEAYTRTPRNQLLPADATNHVHTIASRALRPLPPHCVLLGGSYTNERQDTGDIVLTWREHSRLTLATVIKQSATTETAESGVTYEVDIYAADGTTLLRAVTGLSSPTYTYTNANEISDGGALQTRLTMKVYAKRGGLRSLYPWIRYVYRVDPASFGNSDWILPTQVFDEPHASDSVSGWDELGVEIFQ